MLRLVGWLHSACSDCSKPYVYPYAELCFKGMFLCFSKIYTGALLHSWWLCHYKCRKYLVIMLTRKVPLFSQRSWDLISPMVWYGSFHIAFTWCISLACQFNYCSLTGKPVQPEDLRKIESIVNQQIKEKLEVFAREIKLADAKRINGLRAVFGEVSFLTQLDIPYSLVSFGCSAVSCNGFHIWIL